MVISTKVEDGQGKDNDHLKGGCVVDLPGGLPNSFLWSYGGVEIMC